MIRVEVSNMNLIMSSRELFLILDDCKKRFESINQKPEKTEELFYQDVKPMFELALDKVQMWKPLAEEWVKMNKPKYIHSAQIDSTIDNIEQIVLQSFYKDINKQRFHNLYNSVEYVLSSILSEIECSQ
ncbi:DUF1798 family protein [Metabacillus litoralis]|uniref:DUF1798 family protein n=2 Tax=Metabacillus litoralis TaxID=152268 RepID=A0A5C6W5J9_9BACI|nr:DUF1798 family protein [Metabacillus litoralis]